MSEKPLRARKRRDPLSVFLRVIVWLAAIITVGVFVALVGYILIKGVPNLSLDLFQLKYTSDNCSMLPAIFNTIFMTLLSLVVAVPLGIFSAIYLTEYARRGNKLVKVVRLTTETLQGIPSIVYGLFGYLFFLVQLQWGYSLLAGAMTLAIMILPLIMRTTEEAVLSVPDGYREGSFALGAGRLRTISASCCPQPSPASWRASSSPSAASSARRRRSFTPPAPTPRPRTACFPRCARCRYTCMCFPARGCTSTRLTPRRRCC